MSTGIKDASERSDMSTGIKDASERSDMSTGIKDVSERSDMSTGIKDASERSDMSTGKKDVLIILLFRNSTYHRIIFTCPIGQVGCRFHLPEDAFHLPRAIGKQLMSNPEHCLDLGICRCIVFPSAFLRSCGYATPYS